MGKSKVAETEAKFTQEEMDLAARHREELETLDDEEEKETLGEEADIDYEAKARETLERKKAKAARKRKNKIARDREKEIQLAQESAEAKKTSARTLELEAINAKLQKAGFMLHEIAADGNCLFRAVQHQLTLLGEQEYSHIELRKNTAEYMRSHIDDFLAFFVHNDKADPLTTFELHCTKIRDTSEWGGQPELLALANLLHRPIWIYSKDSPVIKTCDNPRLSPIQLAFHRFYYALGEHYNSVIPLHR
uniref:OTU domain-containing protein n=1 Tax=Aureoumbra lagunensis TaxID=44058 RepID=A0A7S3JPY4_9STRA